jgi:hypothetical protein
MGGFCRECTLRIKADTNGQSALIQYYVPDEFKDTPRRFNSVTCDLSLSVPSQPPAPPTKGEPTRIRISESDIVDVVRSNAGKTYQGNCSYHIGLCFQDWDIEIQSTSTTRLEGRAKATSGPTKVSSYGPCYNPVGSVLPVKFVKTE